MRKYSIALAVVAGLAATLHGADVRAQSARATAQSHLDAAKKAAEDKAV